MLAPRSAAHRALFCQDMLLEVLSDLSPGWFPWNHCDRDKHAAKIQQDLEVRRVLQGTLASCALTCRSLSDLALAELWRVLDHHVLLLKLLPWTTRDDGLCGGLLDLEAEIDDRTWSRFRWYARHVREMKGHVHPDQIGVHRNTWNMLASRLRGEPLLPSVRRLQMAANVEDIVPFLFSLSPTVRIFALEFERGLRAAPEDRTFLLSFLSLISDPSGHPLDPSMCQLISHEEDAEGIVHHLSKCTRLSMLEELDLSKIMYYIHHSSIAALSRLRSLHTVNTGLSIPDDMTTTTPLFTFASFADLRHLTLSVLPLTMLSAVLSSSGLRTSSLRSINLEGDGITADPNLSTLTIPEFQHHLSLIRAALPDVLEALRLAFMYIVRAEPLPLSSLFTPFLTLGRLKSFEVSFHWGYVPHVLDDDLCALAAVWPHLEVLSIWVYELRAPELSDARPPTVAGLAELARGSPRLRRVILPALDVSALPELDALPPDGHRGLRSLDVSALVGDDGVAAKKVARILDRLFPCQEEYSCGGAGTFQTESWLAVQDAMREIQAMRKGVRR